MQYLRQTTRIFLALILCFGLVLLMEKAASAQTVSAYQTNGDRSQLLAEQKSLSFGTTENGSTILTINPAVQYQQMDGFGASMTDSSAFLIYNKLTSTQRSSLMQWFFSGDSGIGLNFLRQPMGATDFTAQGNFSYDDVASGQTDVNLTNFSITKDMTYTIPVLQQAMAVNPNIKVHFLPWSPPAWMKTSGTMNGGNFDDTYYPSLAQYFVKAIQAYQAQGIPIYSIAAQNEPENTNTSYPTEAFSSSEESAFIANYLGPALTTAKLSPKILGYEHNWNDTGYPEAILGDSAAYSYIDGTSWHCYAGSVSAQSTVQSAYPDKGTWFTECSGETTGSFSGDLVWGMENLIIGSTRNWAKSVTEWNLALDENSGPKNGGCSDCRGFVSIDDSESPAKITYNVENYLYGQAAKFVVPGAYRIESNSAAAGTGGIEDVAFQNPNGSVVLIALNDNSASQAFDVNWASNNTNFSYTLPGQSVVTFIWTPLPNPPSKLTATATSNTQISLSWTASDTTAATSSLFRSTTSGFTPSSANKIASGLRATSYPDSSLTSDTTYYYVVEAVNSGGSSTPSNQAQATTQAKFQSTTTLSATPNPASVGQTVSLTATVTGSTPTGTVTFSYGNITLATETLQGAAASYSASTSSIPPGDYAITANYSGDSANKASTSSFDRVVLDAAPTSITLTASPTTVDPPGSVAIKVVVQRTAAGAAGTPTGSVELIVDGAETLTTLSLSSGEASFTAPTKGIPVGNYSLIAKYMGDFADATSTSPAVIVTVQ